MDISIYGPKNVAKSLEIPANDNETSIKNGLIQIIEFRRQFQEALNQAQQLKSQCLKKSASADEKFNEEDKAELLSLYQRAQSFAKLEAAEVHRVLLKVQQIQNIDLSQQIRQKFGENYLEKSNAGRRLRQFLQILDDSARDLPLYLPLTLHQLNQKQSTNFRLQHNDLTVTQLPPLVGSIPLDDKMTIPVGNLVAAWDEDCSDMETQWILGEIVGFDEGGIYTVKDHAADFGEAGVSPKKSKEHLQDMEVENISSRMAEDNSLLLLRRHELIPLPRFRVDPHEYPMALFGPGTIVLARFPQSTCFYRACVLATPENPWDNYKITFDLETDFDFDNFEATIETFGIPQLYVIHYREKPAKPESIDTSDKGAGKTKNQSKKQKRVYPPTQKKKNPKKKI